MELRVSLRVVRLILAWSVIALIVQTYHTILVLSPYIQPLTPIFWLGSFNFWFFGATFFNIDAAWPALLLIVACIAAYHYLKTRMAKSRSNDEPR